MIPKSNLVHGCRGLSFDIRLTSFSSFPSEEEMFVFYIFKSFLEEALVLPLCKTGVPDRKVELYHTVQQVHVYSFGIYMVTFNLE